jgi:hypothetical protein
MLMKAPLRFLRRYDIEKLFLPRSTPYCRQQIGIGSLFFPVSVHGQGLTITGEPAA